MSKSTGGASIPFTWLLGLVFIVLKLTHYIGWAWVWVLAPFWLPFGLALVLGLIALLCFGLAKVFEDRDRKKAQSRRDIVNTYVRHFN